MKILNGKGASAQIAFGKLYFVGNKTKSIISIFIKDINLSMLVYGGIIIYNKNIKNVQIIYKW